jgi:hypothetical protein
MVLNVVALRHLPITRTSDLTDADVKRSLTSRDIVPQAQALMSQKKPDVLATSLQPTEDLSAHRRCIDRHLLPPMNLGL